MSEDVLNVEEFLERVQDDKELLLELLDIFTEDYKGKRSQLQSACENKDFDTLKSVAHSLKGASGNISAKQLRETFMTLEEKGKAQDISDVAELLQKLDTQFEEFEKRMEEVKAQFS